MHVRKLVAQQFKNKKLTKKNKDMEDSTLNLNTREGTKFPISQKILEFSNFLKTTVEGTVSAHFFSDRHRWK